MSKRNDVSKYPKSFQNYEEDDYNQPSKDKFKGKRNNNKKKKDFDSKDRKYDDERWN